MTRQKIGIGIIAFATLLLELAMIRAFDVILDPSMGYMIVTIGREIGRASCRERV